MRKSTLAWFKIDSRKISTVYNGVDLSAFKPAAGIGMNIREAHQIKDRDKVILFLSHVTKQKGVDMAIRAFAEIRRKKSNLKLMIVGDGDYFLKAKRLVRQLKMDLHVFFSGAVEHKWIPNYINAGDILLFPTIRKEGFPFVIIEAMACGKPIVATKIGGNIEALDDGRTGVLIEAGNLNETVKSLEKLLDDDELSRQLGQNAFIEATRRFGIEKMVLGIERVLKTCIS